MTDACRASGDDRGASGDGRGAFGDGRAASGDAHGWRILGSPSSDPYGTGGGGVGFESLLWQPTASSPLDVGPPVGQVAGQPAGGDADGDTVPRTALWAMRARRHAMRDAGAADAWMVCCCLGSPHDALYALDDGPGHCMLAHTLPAADGASAVYLVGRIDRMVFEQLWSGDVAVDAAFDDARELARCAVSDDSPVGNVSVLERFHGIGSVPVEHLPGAG